MKTTSVTAADEPMASMGILHALQWLNGVQRNFVRTTTTTASNGSIGIGGFTGGWV